VFARTRKRSRAGSTRRPRSDPLRPVPPASSRRSCPEV
jgi:hypothetical protein